MNTTTQQKSSSAISIRPLLNTLTLFLLALLPAAGYAQACTDCGNFGINSGAAADLSYDNFVSSFHSTIVRDENGNLKIWGDRSKSTNSNSDYSWLVPTVINSANFSGLTGKPLLGALGSDQTDIQHILLTDDNKIWAWGSAGTVVSTGIKSGNTISSFALPAGVAASDVKMMFATYQTLVLTTCASGNVWVMTQNTNMRGSGAGASNSWYKVQKSTGGDLTNIIATRGCPSGLIALDKTGNLWTWGDETYNNSGNVNSRSTATALPKPATATGNIKMIGASGTRSGATYYLLYDNGNLWAIGDNGNRQLGNWSTTSSNTWVQPRYTSSSGQVMNNIKWISPNEHDNRYPFISVITASGVMYNWGTESGNALARGAASGTTSSATVNPGAPSNFKDGRTNTGIIAVESGGHTTLISKECEANFGYVGHYVRGSMGDGRGGGTSSTESSFTFETSSIQICGFTTSDASIGVSVNATQFCRQAPVILYPNPSGGTFSITSGSSIATLSGTSGSTSQTLSFTGTGEVVVTYKVAAGGCSQATTSKTFVVVNCDPTVTIPGKIWNDNNVNAGLDGGESGTNNGGELWINLVSPDGKVIQSVKVNADGSFNIVVPKSALSASGSYKAIITKSAQSPDADLTEADTPTGYSYTGTNRGGTTGVTGPNSANRSGIIDLGNLSTAANNSTQSPANFGIKEGVLPVNFSSVSATLRGNAITVNWTTEKETNNDHFEIEASADGKKFATIGTVKSDAANGNSDIAISYTFEATTAGLTLGALSLLALGLGMFRSRRKNIAIAVMAFTTILVAAYGCNKKDNSIDLENGTLYIRVAQVDKDGTRSYSKVVQVVKK